MDIKLHMNFYKCNHHSIHILLKGNYKNIYMDNMVNIYYLKVDNWIHKVHINNNLVLHILNNQ